MRKEIRTIMLALLFLPLLLLAGCGRTPQSREAGSTAVIGVLGVEPGPQGLQPGRRAGRASRLLCIRAGERPWPSLWKNCPPAGTPW